MATLIDIISRRPQTMNPEERAEMVRFARVWMSFAEPIAEARGAYESLSQRWQIVNEDGTAVLMYASFNTWGQPQLTPLPYR